MRCQCFSEIVVIFRILFLIGFVELFFELFFELQLAWNNARKVVTTIFMTTGELFKIW